MLKKNLIKLILLLMTFINLDAKQIVVYDNWFNQSYQASKNSIMAGATTATAKGYSALVSNPAGLSSNVNNAVYVRTTNVTKFDSDNKEIKRYSGENVAVGALYNSLAVEVRPDDYALLGGAYGLETKYGLFSIGLSYLVEQSDVTQHSDVEEADKEFVTGDYYTLGVMWQKSFVDEDDFYSIYLGISSKGRSLYKGNKDTTDLEYVSPKRNSYGIGFETNIFDTSILVTTDIFSEEGQAISTDGMSHGAKWMIGSKIGVGAGISNQTFSGNSSLKEISLVGGGVEVGFFGVHVNLSATRRSSTNINEINNLVEEAIHVDVALTF